MRSTIWNFAAAGAMGFLTGVGLQAEVSSWLSSLLCVAVRLALEPLRANGAVFSSAALLVLFKEAT